VQRYLAVRAKLCLVLALAVCCFELYTVGFGVLSPLAQRATLLLFAAILVFLLFPAADWPEKPELGPPVRMLCIAWDVALIAMALVACLYLIVDEDGLADRSGAETTLDLVVAGIGPAMLLEMTRRAVGLPLFLIALGVIAYTYFGDVFLVLGGVVLAIELLRRFVSPKAALAAAAVVLLSLISPDIRGLADPSIYPFDGERYDRMVAYLWLTSEGTFGTIAAIMSQFIFIFILFAGLLDSTGAGQVFIQLAFALTGRFRGGPAQSAVAASSMFGMVSGSTMANVVSTGTFTIPLMIRTGFSRRFSGAVEAVASCGGQIVPPIMGASVFIMSEIIGVPYVNLMLYALIPAVLYFGSLSCAIYFESARLGLERIPASDVPSAREQLRIGGYLLIPIVFLLVSIISGETPGLAGYKAVITLLVLIDLVRALRRSQDSAGPRGIFLVGAWAGVCLALAFGSFLLPAALTAPFELPAIGATTPLRLFFLAAGAACLLLPRLRCLPVVLPLALATADWSTVRDLAANAGNPALAAIIGFAALAAMAALVVSASKAPPDADNDDQTVTKLGRDIVSGFDKGARNALSLVAATYVIGIIVGLLVLTALGVRISILVTDVAATSLFLAFFLVMIASLIMGMGLPTVAAYLLLVIVVAPAISKLGAPLVAAHMFIFYYGVLSSITPPVALAAYGASGLSGADPLSTAVTACRLAITAFVVPYLFVYHPELLLLEGTAGEIAYRLAVSAVGIFFISMAAIGHGLVPLGLAARAILTVASLLLFFDAPWLNGAGVALGIAQIAMQRRARPDTRSAG